VRSVVQFPAGPGRIQIAFALDNPQRIVASAVTDDMQFPAIAVHPEDLAHHLLESRRRIRKINVFVSFCGDDSDVSLLLLGELPHRCGWIPTSSRGLPAATDAADGLAKPATQKEKLDFHLVSEFVS